MKLIIDIPDYDYRQIKECYEKNDTVEATYSYIYHGIPLPKGQGKRGNMTREEAIEVIKEYRDKLTHSVSNQLDGDIEAFDMAINALHREQQFLEAGYKNGRVEFNIGGRKFMVKEMAQ